MFVTFYPLRSLLISIDVLIAILNVPGLPITIVVLVICLLKYKIFLQNLKIQICYCVSEKNIAQNFGKYKAKYYVDILLREPNF